jgi:multiple sugar transport system ATP-binding protein
MNLMTATVHEGQAKIGDYLVPLDPTAAKKADGEIVVGVRPESWRLVGAEDGGLPVDVTVVEELGSDAFVYGTSGVEGTPNSIIVRVSGRDAVHKGDVIHVTTEPKSVHVFDAASGDRLNS